MDGIIEMPIFREKISLSNVFDRNLDLVYETEELQS